MKYKKKQTLYKCDQLNNQVGGGLGYQKIVCALKNLKSKTQLRDGNRDDHFGRAGLNSHLRMDNGNIARTGSDAFLVNNWKYCWWKDMNNTCPRSMEHEDYSCV